jgi:exopolyphosphatase/guanosine-5'-triphosphate,3'-diphosphate pyrophosphatase
MKNQAVIDIGTNSILLLIARSNEDGGFESVKQVFTVTRLGESITGKKIITEPAFKRSLGVLQEYRDMIARYQVENIYILGTEMLRQAKNSEIFQTEIRNRFGRDVTVISGEEEGRYTYIGAIAGIAVDNRQVLVVDVGGGSTEIIRGTGKKIERVASLPLGVVRLAEKHGDVKNWSAKLDRELIREIERSIGTRRDVLTGAPDAIMIGSGGTVTTVAAIQKKMRVYEPDAVLGHLLSIDTLESMYDEISRMKVEQRRAITGMLPGREDVLPFGILIYITLMKLAGIRSLYATDRGLRFGYLSEKLAAGE